jgi:hypothetical protein
MQAKKATASLPAAAMAEAEKQALEEHREHRALAAEGLLEQTRRHNQLLERQNVFLEELVEELRAFHATAQGVTNLLTNFLEVIRVAVSNSTMGK